MAIVSRGLSKLCHETVVRIEKRFLQQWAFLNGSDSPKWADNFDAMTMKFNLPRPLPPRALYIVEEESSQRPITAYPPAREPGSHLPFEMELLAQVGAAAAQSDGPPSPIPPDGGCQEQVS